LPKENKKSGREGGGLSGGDVSIKEDRRIRVTEESFGPSGRDVKNK